MRSPPTLSLPLEGGGSERRSRSPLKGEGRGGGDSRRILMAVITAAHGVKGLVRLKSFAADSQDIGHYPLVDERGERVPLTVAGPARGALLARIEGINDRNAAERLKGKRLYVERSALPELERDEFYCSDLLGLAAELKDGTVLGHVTAVNDFGAGDTIEIERPSGGQPIVVPFTRAVVPVVDLKHRRILIEPPAGLL
jgi:16S rRNA processing protein RimM